MGVMHLILCSTTLSDSTRFMLNSGSANIFREPRNALQSLVKVLPSIEAF